MTSLTGNIPEENVENHPPSTLLCTNNGSFPDAKSSKVKRNDYLKQRGRRKRWWYLNRGLQPIYEAGENTVVTENINSDEYLNIKNNSLNNDDTSSDIIITGNINQSKESYSPCLKVIEKFQEIVMDSAVRVIQAAFKRFRERRRFLRIKKAVMVIQRNLRKWIQARHPCLRPAEFNRQSSDSAKSDEYRETDNKSVDDKILDESDNNHMEEPVHLAECNKMNAHNAIEQQGTVCTSSSEACELKSLECREGNIIEHANKSMEICNDNTTSTDCSMDQKHDINTVDSNYNEEIYKVEACADEIASTEDSIINKNIESTNQNVAMDYQPSDQSTELQDIDGEQEKKQCQNEDSIIDKNIESSNQNVAVDYQQSDQSTELQDIDGEQEKKQCEEEIKLQSLQSDDGIQNASNVEALTESEHDNFNGNIKVEILHE